MPQLSKPGIAPKIQADPLLRYMVMIPERRVRKGVQSRGRKRHRLAIVRDCVEVFEAERRSIENDHANAGIMPMPRDANGVVDLVRRAALGFA